MADGAAQPTISTHVLDVEHGTPASGVRVTLSRLDVAGGKPIRMTQALTDGDGRVRDLLERPMQAGDYRLEFDVAHAPEQVGEHYPGLDQDLLRECRILMLAMITAWRWDRHDTLPGGRRLAAEWLGQLRAGIDH